MEKTTTERTVEYIKEHPHIKSCLKKSLINYSALARLIAKELDIEKKTSKEAILIAARRFKAALEKEFAHEKKIKDLLAKSEIEVKNKIVVFILEKNIDLDNVEYVQKTIRKELGMVYLLEGSNSYTLITQEKYETLIKNKFKSNVVKENTELASILIKSAKDIEETPGVAAYLTTLFAENGVNIIELVSCWTDTLFVIDKNDVNKAINFLKF